MQPKYYTSQQKSRLNIYKNFILTKDLRHYSWHYSLYGNLGVPIYGNNLFTLSFFFNLSDPTSMKLLRCKVVNRKWSRNTTNGDNRWERQRRVSSRTGVKKINYVNTQKVHEMKILTKQLRLEIFKREKPIYDTLIKSNI